MHRTPQSVMEEQLKAWDSVLLRADEGAVLPEGRRKSEGVVAAGRLLRPPEHGRLQARVQALLPEPDRFLVSDSGSAP